MDSCRYVATSASLCLENAHQGSKMFAWEIDTLNQEPTPHALEFRKAFWEDTKPKRHKFPLELMRRYAKKSGCNVNNCMEFSFFYGFHGKRVKLTYQQARMFYVQWYVYYAQRSESFRWLCEKLSAGYDIEICGYDVPFEGKVMKDNIINLYEDVSTPYGHECVLAAMLLGIAPHNEVFGQNVYKGLFPTYREAPHDYEGPFATESPMI